MGIIKSKQTIRPELVRSVSYPYNIHGTRMAPAPPRRFWSPGKALVALFAVGIAGFLLLSPGSPDSSTLSATTGQQEIEIAAEKPQPKELDHTALSSEVEAIVAEYASVDIGVSWIDIETGDSRDYGVQDPFVAASTAKLLTAIAFLHDVENGTNSLNDTVGTRTARAALEAMIVKSDNEAWHDFNNTVMSHEELAEYASKIGFSSYDPDKNTITPGSLAKLLSNFYQKRLLNEEHTNLLLSFMKQAYEPQVNYVPSLAPSGTTVYHKPGYLKDRMHDAAIIDNGGRPYVLVLFTKSRTGVYDTSYGADIFTRITKASLASFSQ